MRYYRSVCNETISEKVFKHSMRQNGAALCMNHQKTVTPQALRLSNALNNFDVKHKLEYDDGFKHVDIAIEWAKIYIELDGAQHAFSPKQMCADDERDKHSLRAGLVTEVLGDNDDTAIGSCGWALSFRDKPKLSSSFLTETRLLPITCEMSLKL
jgi:very-short-patch-repair endonuclease